MTSATSVTGNLGGLTGADGRCQSLAAGAGLGAKTWRAYLSVERDASNGGQPTNARDRIGVGPWTNVNGVIIAETLADLHARRGDANIFVDESGTRINGQWPGSPAPVQHDILTGSNADGTLLPGPPAPTGRRTRPRYSRRSVTRTDSDPAATRAVRWPRGTRRM